MPVELVKRTSRRGAGFCARYRDRLCLGSGSGQVNHMCAIYACRAQVLDSALDIGTDFVWDQDRDREITCVLSMPVEHVKRTSRRGAGFCARYRDRLCLGSGSGQVNHMCAIYACRAREENVS
ncbi:hypothetical protein J6590_047419 [Homalodisca vitripennis]|nr:hypothetical protein J6590_047419 [Homalodisca vitripennis]